MRPHHKQQFEDMCFQLTGQSCSCQPEHSLSHGHEHAQPAQDHGGELPSRVSASDPKDGWYLGPWGGQSGYLGSYLAQPPCTYVGGDGITIWAESLMWVSPVPMHSTGPRPPGETCTWGARCTYQV